MNFYFDIRRFGTYSSNVSSYVVIISCSMNGETKIIVNIYKILNHIYLFGSGFIQFSGKLVIMIFY